MRKFLETLFVTLLVIIILVLLYSVVNIVSSWSYKPEDQIVKIPIFSGAEITLLESEKELPSESSLQKIGKEKVYISHGIDAGEDILQIWLLSPKISERFFYQEIKISPYKNLQYKRSWLKIFSRPEFHVKNISLKENSLLKIELGISKMNDIFAIFISIFLSLFAIFFLIIFFLTREEKKEG